uniref:Uncharacterized protein n=1 Tax=Anguilla anguilla TaxID=7936 RepID=A0A0E9U461_ANGAN
MISIFVLGAVLYLLVYGRFYHNLGNVRIVAHSGPFFIEVGLLSLAG